MCDILPLPLPPGRIFPFVPPESLHALSMLHCESLPLLPLERLVRDSRSLLMEDCVT